MSITVMGSTLDFMYMFQIWPQREEELDPSKWYYIRFFLVLATTLINLIGSVLHLFLVSIPSK